MPRSFVDARVPCMGGKYPKKPAARWRNFVHQPRVFIVWYRAVGAQPGTIDMAYDIPPPKMLPEPGYYYHFKHDPNGPLNNYAYYIYGVGHHTEEDCRPEDVFMQV